LSPLAVLARGYSLTRRLDDLSVVRQADRVESGDWLVTQVAQGRIVSRVEAVGPEPEHKPDAQARELFSSSGQRTGTDHE